MGDFAFLMGVLTLVLAVIAILGHGIWVLTASVFRAVLGSGPQDVRRPVRCVFCTKLTSPNHDRCDWCGCELSGELANELKDLAAVERQLRRFRARGDLKSKVVDEMLARVKRYRERRLNPPTELRPAAAASTEAARPTPATAHDQLKAAARPGPSAPPTVPASATRQPAPPIPHEKRPTPTPPTETPPRKTLFSPPAAATAAEPASAADRPPAAAKRPIAPAAQPAKKPVTAPPQPPPVPRRSWPDMVAGFMQEQNIRWGELVGGVLIVGSSVALVLSLWDTLKEIRYFPFFIFVAVTAALFGVGLYARHRWKLESTSYGLLVIATLLVPLDFLAMAAFSKDTWDIVTVLTGLGGLALFAWLVRRAAEILTPAWRLPQVVTVVGSSAAILLIAWRIGPLATPVSFFAAGAVPVACFAGAVGWAMRRLPRPLRVTPAAAGHLFTLLGTGGFATVAALGLLTAQSGELAGALDRLSVFVAIMGVPVLACGLAIARGAERGTGRRVADPSAEGLTGKRGEPVRRPPGTTLPGSGNTASKADGPAASRGEGQVTSEQRSQAAAAYHTAGTATALIGMLVMLVALTLAWPHPLGIILVGGLNAAALALAAFWFHWPILHVGAIACATVVYLIGFHVAYPPSGLALLAGSEDLASQLLRLLLDASSGTSLAGLFVLLAAAAESLARTGRHRHGIIYAGGAAVVAVAGLLLVTRDGLASGGSDAVRAACLYALFAAGGLILGGRWRQTNLNIASLALLTATPLWLLWSRIALVGTIWDRVEHIDSMWAAVLAGEAVLLAVIAAWLSFRDGHLEPSPTDPPKRRGSWGAVAGRSLSVTLVDSYRLPLLYVTEALAILAVLVGTVTAWLDRATLVGSPWPVLTAAGTAAAYLLLAWLWNTAERTWVGSMIVLAGLAHTLALNFPKLVEPAWVAWTVALLAHSTLAVLASVATSSWGSREGTIARGERVDRLFQRPLADSAVVSSVVAAATLPLVIWYGMTMTSLAWCLGWIAAIWLVEAWRRRQPMGFAAHQVMLVTAGLAAVTAWLQRPQPWVAELPRDLADPRSIAAYIVAVALLALMWTVARMGLRGQPVATQLLNPPWPSVDWMARHAAVWLLFGAVVVFSLPSAAREFAPGLTKTTSAVASGGVWLAAGLLALVLVVALWEKFGRAELIGSLLLAATVPGLIAGANTFVADQAVGSALRWGLAVSFVICSAGIWGRQGMAALSQRWKCQIAVRGRGPQLAHTTLLVVTLVPVLSMTVLAAVRQIVGLSLGGPAAGSWFATVGPTISYLVPLLLLVVGLVGSAVRERSADYAFSAGLIVELAVGLGYALYIVSAAALQFGVDQLVTLVQLLTITAAAWAGAWLAIRHWLDVWREVAAAPRARLLMNLQLGMGAVGNGLLISVAVATVAVFHPHDQDWTIAAGQPLGWIAILSVAAVYVYRQTQSSRGLSPQLVGLLGMTLLALVACTTEWQWPGWGYRTLMLGWAVYAWSVVSATWWVASTVTRPEAQGPPQALIRAAGVWVRLAGISAVLLGLKLAVVRGPGEDLLWAAAAIAIASAAGATMAVWQRREGWAFAAALGVNLAASLVVWHYRRELEFGQWWLSLIQANLVASSAVALVWLAVRRRLYQLRELRLGESPLLAVQTALPVFGNVAILSTPVVWLLGQPDRLPADATQLAAAPGWLALLLTAAAAGWYVYQVAPPRALTAVVTASLGFGVLCGCHAQPLAEPAWRAYHTLMIAWAVVGLVVLAAGLLAEKIRFGPQLVRDGVSMPLLAVVVPAQLVETWVTAIGLLVVLLATLHSATDPQGPWWSAGAMFATSLMAGVVAIWRRRPAHVYVSGLLLCGIGVIAWLVWDTDNSGSRLMASVVLGLGCSSALWSVIGLAWRDGVPHPQVGGQQLPFARLAGEVGVALLGARVVAAVVASITGPRGMADFATVGQLDSLALTATLVAVGLGLWQRRTRLAVPGLWLVGLEGIVLGLCALELQPAPQGFCWAACVALAGLVLVTALLGTLLPRLTGLWQALRIPEDSRRGPAGWLPAVQAVVTGVVVLTALWVAVDADFQGVALPQLGWPTGQVGAPIAMALLLAAAVMMPGVCRGSWRTAWQETTFGLGMLLLATIGFVWLVPESALWLHRSVIVLVAAVATGLIAGLGPAWLAPSQRDWIAAGRQVASLCAALAIAMLALVLVQEAWLFDRAGDGVVAWPAAVVVAGAIAGLIVMALGVALRPDWDPLQLSDRGRTAYVYAAELLGGLLALHLWLALPWLFRYGIVERYWMLIVMAIAAAGAGLSELFQRRRLPVLSEPLARTALLLPLVPIVGFWFVDSSDAATWLPVGASPSLWFVIGLFYGVMAITRQSVVLAGLAIVTANTGLWVLWHRQGWDFFDRPQLWLIPIAIAVLVAEYLDRGRLSPTQRTSIRYIALALVYVSSTTEFMRGIGDSIVLPLVLVGLSLLGVLAGILLRVRSFLYLGTTFLLVVIVRMIVYAAFEQGQMWVFWSCCIMLGAAIIAMFAVFEKRRNDVIGAMERLKEWEG